METAKKTRLEKAGWRVGSAGDFLRLSSQEQAYVELKVALSRNLQKKRTGSRLSQQQLARKIRSSQSRVAKMEKGDPSVSLDLLVKSLLALGSSRQEITRALAMRA